MLQAGGTIRETETEALVASIGNDMQPLRMDKCRQLWASGIKAEFGYKPNPKMADQVGGFHCLVCYQQQGFCTAVQISWFAQCMAALQSSVCRHTVPPVLLHIFFPSFCLHLRAYA